MLSRAWAIAPLVAAGLAFAAPSQAATKHHALKCRAGYVRHTVRAPVRKHGRIVRKRGKIVYRRVQRCVKVTKPKPNPKPTTTTPTAPTPRPPVVPPPSTPTTPSPPPPPPPPSPSPPANTVRPAIGGTTKQGGTLSASQGTWINSPTSYGYQWQDCSSNVCTNIPNATSSMYTLQSSDVFHSVVAIVTARNSAGSASASSNPTAVITHAGDPVVVAVGDIACPAGETTNSTNCQQAATATLAANQNPDDILPLGDNQYNSGLLSEFQGQGAYNTTWGVFNPIVHPVPGNHEYDTSGAGGYFQYFGAAANPPNGNYSFNIGAWHVIALNSDCSGTTSCSDSVAGNTTSAQVSWLQSDLAAHPAACTLAYWHHPLFSDGDIGDSPGVAPLWSALYNAHADVVLNGHDHLYERYAQQDPSGTATPSGIREFVVGTGGENLVSLDSDPHATLQAHDDTDFGVLKLTLHASSYDWAYVNTDGTTIDSGTTACHGSGTGATASAARDIAAADVPALLRREPKLVFDARPLASSLTAAVRRGLPVAIHCSRGCDVAVTASLRLGRHVRRIASFYETESQITKPYSDILLRLPARRLQGRGRVTLVLRFAALDAAGHHRTVTRIVALRRS